MMETVDIYGPASQDLSFRPEADVPETVETNPETRGLNFSDDLYQADIPKPKKNPVGEDTKDMSSVPNGAVCPSW